MLRHTQRHLAPCESKVGGIRGWSPLGRRGCGLTVLITQVSCVPDTLSRLLSRWLLQSTSFSTHSTVNPDRKNNTFRKDTKKKTFPTKIVCSCQGSDPKVSTGGLKIVSAVAFVRGEGNPLTTNIGLWAILLFSRSVDNVRSNENVVYLATTVLLQSLPSYSFATI